MQVKYTDIPMIVSQRCGVHRFLVKVMLDRVKTANAQWGLVGVLRHVLSNSGLSFDDVEWIAV